MPARTTIKWPLRKDRFPGDSHLSSYKKRSYLFLLSEESSEDDVVQTLYMEKLIHRLPATYYNPDDERRYQFFQLDYGTTIDRLMANAVRDVRASYESSVWVKIGAIGNKFLGRSLDRDVADQRSAAVAAFTALFKEEPGRLDVDPKEVILHAGDRIITGTRKPRSAGAHGRHRRA